MNSKTFLITGVSSGFGRALATKALAAGHRVIGTVRNEDDLQAFSALHATRAKGCLLDVTEYTACAPLVAQVAESFGAIDVLVNNAGYGHEGILEESSFAEIEQQFAVNVFGGIAMIKAVLPGMRERRQGHILNITSMGGYITMPGIADYCGSKFAMVGISDALSKELAPFNIHVTSVAPGSFRTDWAGRSMQRTPRTISDYDASFDPIRQAREAKHGNQLGDPEKAAEAMLTLTSLEKPPGHLVLGNDALSLIRTQLDTLSDTLNEWESLTCSTDATAK